MTPFPAHRPNDPRKSKGMKVFWFFFSKKNKSSFVNSRAQARQTERSKKLHPFFLGNPPVTDV
jgi:hypothetical protein